MKDCPDCLNSSGYKAFTPRTQYNQKCDTCYGTGKISNKEYKKKEYKKIGVRNEQKK